MIQFINVFCEILIFERRIFSSSQFDCNIVYIFKNMLDKCFWGAFIELIRYLTTNRFCCVFNKKIINHNMSNFYKEHIPHF